MAGEILRKRREELGVDIAEVSEALKISSEYLLSIENDLFDKLPVAVYTVGYIRCYAKYLDVDAAPVISSFMSHLSSPKPSTIIPVSSSRRKVPNYIYATVLVLTGMSAFVIYLYAGKDLARGSKVETAAPPVKEGNTIPAAPLISDSAPVKMPEEIDTGVNKAGDSQPAVADRAEHQLGITASDNVWMRIRFANGKQEELLLRSGSSKSWTFEGQAVLKIGNAGGAALKLDGKDLGVQGELGKVLDLTLPQG